MTDCVAACDASRVEYNSLAQKFVETLGTEGKLQSIGATLKASDERAQQRAAEKDELRLERATNIFDKAPTRGKEGILTPAAVLSDTAGRVMGDVLNAGVSTAGFLFSLIDPAEDAWPASKGSDQGRSRTRGAGRNTVRFFQLQSRPRPRAAERTGAAGRAGQGARE